MSSCFGGVFFFFVIYFCYLIVTIDTIDVSDRGVPGTMNNEQKSTMRIEVFRSIICATLLATVTHNAKNTEMAHKLGHYHHHNFAVRLFNSTSMAGHTAQHTQTSDR